MKQIITLCLAVFFMAGIQDIQAQTKEETIQWLNDYGSSIEMLYQNNYGYKISYELNDFDGEFLNFTTESILRKSDKIVTNQVQKFKVLPKDILYQDIIILEKDEFYDEFYIKAKSGTIFHYGKGQAYDNGYAAPTIDNKAETERKISEIYFQFTREDSKDAVRLFKAIMHLAKLSGADELPKVTENTF